MEKNLNNFYTRFANDKKLRRVIIAIAALGIALLALSELFDFSQKKSSAEEDKSMTAESYRLELEHRITQLISELEGVGKAKVMINFSDASGGGTLSGAETYQSRRVTGVLVICEGGDDGRVVARLTQAVSVALSVDYNKIYIAKMQSGGA